MPHTQLSRLVFCPKPTVAGRISIGHLERTDGEAVTDSPPTLVADDEFSLLTLEQHADLRWEAHEIAKTLRAASSMEKLISLPVVLPFNDPALILNVTYAAGNGNCTGISCRGDGTLCARADEGTVQFGACPKPDYCGYATETPCSVYATAYFRLEGQDDEAAVFEFRTQSKLSAEYLERRLRALQGLARGELAGMPLSLVLKKASNESSDWKPFYYVDLVPRSGQTLAEAVAAARSYRDKLAADGLSLDGLEAVLREVPCDLDEATPGAFHVDMLGVGLPLHAVSPKPVAKKDRGVGKGLQAVLLSNKKRKEEAQNDSAATSPLKTPDDGPSPERKDDAATTGQSAASPEAPAARRGRRRVSSVPATIDAMQLTSSP